MRSFITIATLLASCFSASALPSLVRRDAIDEKTIMNFALTLEHLENAFYTEALQKFDEKAFADAGLPKGTRGRFVQIAQHEKDHVDFLTKALGADATKPCEYSFPYTDPKSFAALSEIFERVGAGAYTGAAHFLQTESVVTAASSILATEARQATWVASAVNNNNPWSESYETPLTLSEAFNLGAPFIKSCPSTNPVLPVKQFKTLTFKDGSVEQSKLPVKPGQPAIVNVDDALSGSGNWVAFLHGKNIDYRQVTNNTVTIPSTLYGVVYAVLTTSNEVVNDDTTIAGPAILSFGLDADAVVPSSN